jgi:hypothetical protein
MDSKLMVDSKIIEAFHLMWSKFPEPAMLIHKTREILAVNEACKNAEEIKGIIDEELVGKKCVSMMSPEIHRGCLANKALQTQQAMSMKKEFGGLEVSTYWIPVSGCPDVYVHFRKINE